MLTVPFTLDERDNLFTLGKKITLGEYTPISEDYSDKLQDLDRDRVPSYFDVLAALASEGPCYTFPSPTLRALEAALQEYATPPRAQATYRRYAELGEYVRSELRRLGLEPLARDACACPVVTSFAPPGQESSTSFVARCRSWGYAIGGQSGYLAEKRLVQIATMGAVTRDQFSSLFDHIDSWLHSTPVPKPGQVALAH